MHAVLVLWDLSKGANVGYEELRQYLRDESMARFREMPGLRQKTWISNPATGKWGAFYLFEAKHEADDLVSHIAGGRASTLIGLQPLVQQFEVEAVVEGRHHGTDLLAAGLVHEV